MATTTLEAKAHSAYCEVCGKFEFDTGDIGHNHLPGEISCLGCQYFARCPTCDTIVYVGKHLSYIDLSELFTKRSLIIDDAIVSCTLKFGEE